jgi:phosphate transport system protein
VKSLEGHISRAFDGDMGALHLHVVTMGSLAVDQVRLAVRAYVAWNATEAATVLERERTVNAYDTALDDEQLLLLARRQPVASDLKFVIAFSKAVAELERVGDEAKKIARIVRDDRWPADPAALPDVAALGQRAESMLRQALEAFDAIDVAAAEQVIVSDKVLDAQYEQALERLLDRPAAGPAQFRSAVHCAFVMKSLERVGDHARNIARLLKK